MTSKLAKNVVAISSLAIGCISLLALIIGNRPNVPVFVWGIIFICFGIILLVRIKPTLMKGIFFFEFVIYCFGILVSIIFIFVYDVLTGSVGLLLFGVPFSFCIVYLVKIKQESQII